MSIHKKSWDDFVSFINNGYKGSCSPEDCDRVLGDEMLADYYATESYKSVLKESGWSEGAIKALELSYCAEGYISVVKKILEQTSSSVN